MLKKQDHGSSLLDTEKSYRKKIKGLFISGFLLQVATYIVMRQTNYIQRINVSTEDLVRENQSLSEVLKESHISRIEITSIGNSIASGYSIKDPIRPLLSRNLTLKEILNKSNIWYTEHQFARPMDNCDEHILEWYLKNFTESDLNRMIQVDLLGEFYPYHKDYLEGLDLQKTFPTEGKDETLQSIVNKKDENGLNILVYNGATGSFLDSLTRKGKLFTSFGKDIDDIDAMCQMVFLENKHTQIYLCGVPNYFNIGLTDLVNSHLKEVADRYPNVVYVDSAPIRVFYSTENGMKLDTHYCKEEYELLLQNVVGSIRENCIANEVCATLYDNLKEHSTQMQFGLPYNQRDQEKTNQVIDDTIDSMSELDPKEMLKGLQSFAKVYDKSYSYDFYFTDKQITSAYLEDKIAMQKEKVLRK